MLVQTWLTLANTSSFKAHGVISLSKYVAQRCGSELGCGVGSSQLRCMNKLHMITTSACNTTKWVNRFEFSWKHEVCCILHIFVLKDGCGIVFNFFQQEALVLVSHC